MQDYFDKNAPKAGANTSKFVRYLNESLRERGFRGKFKLEVRQDLYRIVGAFAAELLRLAAKDAGAKEDAESKEPGEGERRPTAIGPEHIVKALQQMGLSKLI